MFIWVQLEYTLDGHCLGRTTFPIGREPPSSMCFASWFPPCRWDVFLIRKKYVSHRQGGTGNREATRIVVGNSLSMEKSCQQAASKEPASRQQTSNSKQPASSQPASSQPASSKPAASKQAKNKQQAISSKLPTTMCVNSMFHPCLWGKFFFQINFSHRQGGNREAKHIDAQLWRTTVCIVSQEVLNIWFCVHCSNMLQPYSNCKKTWYFPMILVIFFQGIDA